MRCKCERLLPGLPDGCALRHDISLHSVRVGGVLCPFQWRRLVSGITLRRKIAADKKIEIMLDYHSQLTA